MKQKSNKLFFATAVALTLALGAGTTYNAVVNSEQQKEINALQETRDKAADEIYSQTKEYLTSYVDSDSYVKALQSNESFKEAVESSSTALLTEEQIEVIVETVTEAAKEMLLSDDILEGTTSLKAYDLQYVKELIKDEVTSNIGKEIEILADDCITQADINEMMNKLYARLDDQMKEAMSVNINNMIVQELQSLTSGMVLTQAEKDAFMKDIENTVYNELMEKGIGGNGTVTTLSLTNAQIKQLVNQLTEKVSKPVKGKDYLTESEVKKMTDTVSAIVEANVLATLRSDSADSINTIKSDLSKIKNDIDRLGEILADIQNGDLDVYLTDATKSNIADLDKAVNRTLDDAAKIKADQENLENNIKSLLDGDVVGKLENIEKIGGDLLPEDVIVPGTYGKTNLEASLNWLNSRLDLKDYSIRADQVTYKDTNVENALNAYLDRSKELQEGLYIVDKNLGLATEADENASIDTLLGYLNTNISSGSGNGTVINTKDATATENDILYGKTAYVKGKKETGTIPSLGAKTYTPGTTDQTINSGRYLSGDQTIAGDANLVSENIKSGTSIFGITGDSNVIDTSEGDATAANILSGKKAGVDGEIITGSMSNKGGSTVSSTNVTESGSNAIITIPSTGYYTTSSKISVPISTLKNNCSSLNSSTPSGTKTITNNGTYDVSNYASAYVNVNPSGQQSGDGTTKKCVSGSYTATTTYPKSITCSFEPSYISLIQVRPSGAAGRILVYNSSFSTTKVMRASAENYITTENLGIEIELTSTGFKVLKNFNDVGTFYWTAYE